MVRRLAVLLVLSVVAGCGSSATEHTTRPAEALSQPSQPAAAGETQPAPMAPSRPVAWRHAGSRVLGVDGTRAFAWERRGHSENLIVATSLVTGEELSRRPLVRAPYIGEPRAWWTIGDLFVVHWDGVGSVRESDAAWTAGTVSAPFSVCSPAPDGTLLLADRHVVARLRLDGGVVFTHALPRGAQPPEFFVGQSAIGLAFQQYSTTSPTTQLDIPHRVQSIALDTGAPRWTRDFTENLGAVHVHDDVLIIAQGADLVFLDGPSGAERARHRALGPPHIYPRIVSDAARVVVAVDPYVRAYDLRGAALWQTRVDGLGNGARMAIQGDDVFVTTGDGTLVRLALGDGSLGWRIGTAIASGWVWATPSAVLVDSRAVRVGVPLPLPSVTLARARVRGRVDLGTCSASDVTVSAQRVSVTPAADGTFALDVESVGFLGVQASRTPGEASESELPCPESFAVVELDGSAEYSVALRACCDGRARR